MIARVPATSANLGPGFDCMGLALKWHNYFAARPSAMVELPEEYKDGYLVYDAMLACWRELGVAPIDVRVEEISENGFPQSRGMGSSAACIAAGILLAAKLAGKNMHVNDMIKLGAKLEGHPDNIAAAFLGGCTVALGGGDDIDVIKLRMPDNLRAIIFWPEVRVSTSAARAVLPDTVPFDDAVFNACHSAMLAAAIATGDIGKLARAMQDRLHQKYRCKLIYGYENIEEIALAAGALCACISGSGSAVLTLFEHSAANNATINEISRRISKLDGGWQASLLEFDCDGAVIIEG